MSVHDGSVDAIACSNALGGVSLEMSHGGLHVSRGDRKNRGFESHQVSRHLDGSRKAPERAVTVQNLLNDLDIKYHLHSTAGNLRHDPLTGISVGMGRAGGIHRHSRVQQRRNRGSTHLLHGSSNNLLFHLVPIRHGQLERKKPLQSRLSLMDWRSSGVVGMVWEQGSDHDLDLFELFKRKRLRRVEHAVFLGGFNRKSNDSNSLKNCQTELISL